MVKFPTVAFPWRHYLFLEAVMNIYSSVSCLASVTCRTWALNNWGYASNWRFKKWLHVAWPFSTFCLTLKYPCWLKNMDQIFECHCFNWRRIIAQNFQLLFEHLSSWRHIFLVLNFVRRRTRLTPNAIPNLDEGQPNFFSLMTLFRLFFR